MGLSAFILKNCIGTGKQYQKLISLFSTLVPLADASAPTINQQRRATTAVAQFVYGPAIVGVCWVVTVVAIAPEALVVFLIISGRETVFFASSVLKNLEAYAL